MVRCFIALCRNNLSDFGVIKGISKAKEGTLLLCVVVLAERKIKYEKMNNKSMKTLKSIFSVCDFRRVLTFEIDRLRNY